MFTVMFLIEITDSSDISFSCKGISTSCSRLSVLVHDYTCPIHRISKNTRKSVPSCLGSEVPGPSSLKLKIKSVALLHFLEREGGRAGGREGGRHI